MSDHRYAVAGHAKPTGWKAARIALCLMWSMFVALGAAAAFLVAQTAQAQVQPSNPPSVPVDYAELAGCKQFVPIAKELNERIVDYINSPRPDFKCSEFAKTVWDGSRIYSIIRIANPKFCYEKYCYTLVYSERTNNIVFSTDAESLIEQFTHATDHIISLNKILNHKFINTHNGVLLSTPDGPLAISVTNEILTVSIVSKKGNK